MVECAGQCTVYANETVKYDLQGLRLQKATSTPAGSTIIPIILASDKTILTSHTGGLKAHPLYLSIGNIHKGARAMISRGAYVLLAYIPIIDGVKTRL